MKRFLHFSLVIISPFTTFSQVWFSNGADITFNPGSIVHCNGGMSLSNTSLLTNNGNLRITKNSTLPQAGNFIFNSLSEVNGNGKYAIEQDWINDAQFVGENSEVILFGNTEQLITSTTSVVTQFNDLSLTGTGTGLNRRKSLQNVDAEIGVNGTLSINDRELNTSSNQFTVLNPASNSVGNSTTFGNEGFVSSNDPGYFVRVTNQSTSYLFPVGSSAGTLRYRPVQITPSNANNHHFEVRLNNYSADSDGFFLAQHTEEIESANDLFYHSIERSVGSGNATIRVNYIPNSDGDWLSTAHWYGNESLWKDLTNTNANVSGNFSYSEKADWDFPTNDHAYVLVNTIEQLVIPNVFTPNGDGANDLFFVTSNGLTEYNLTIVNRWGNTVFESTDPNEGWDGKSNGDPCTDGTYFYILKAKSNSKEFDKHGHITLNAN
jgi:gliding motility-associated-like protein